jgi:hypothetical protein
VLAFYPCADGGRCADEYESIALADGTDHDHHESETDHCSPLCICSCCATVFQITRVTIDIPIHVTHHTPVTTPYIEANMAGDIYSIWQPPRLS